ncbi:hypothetical protein KC333_g8564 [Hortaea werneckii]|nr:hypothetical protein KC333_g8564 [Hortaea werneckii]KAI7303866.1 hypothetical protein KC326_g8596 [Hortaea werneckii]
MAFQLLATALLAAHLTLAAPGSVCSKLPYKAFLPLSKNAFVESVCSSKFPVVPVTVTSSTTYTTSTATASTTTTISETTSPIVVVYSTETDVFTSTLSSTDVQTEVSTTTISTTSTSTSIVGTSTTTIVTNTNGATFKRAVEAQITPAAALEGRAAAAPAAGVHGFNNNARAKSASSACASFTKGVNAVRSIFSTACSCIETPITYQATATSTITTTSTSTISSTTTFTSPTTTTSIGTTSTTTSTTTTFSSTTTSTSTTTTTISAVATSNAVVSFNACGQNFPAPSSGTPNGIRCGQTIAGSYTLRSSSVVNSFYQCLTASDADFSSTSFTYQFSTGTCNIYYNTDGSNNQFTANADFVYGYYYP